MVSTLVLIYFERPRIAHTIKAKCITFQTVDPEIYSNLIFYKKILKLTFYYQTIFLHEEKVRTKVYIFYEQNKILR